MEEYTYSQTRRAMRDGDAFAKVLLGISYIDDGRNQSFVDLGCDLVRHAGETQNCIWAKNVISYLATHRRIVPPVGNFVPVEEDAMTQLKIYADSGNMWAMTAYGDILYKGTSGSKDQVEGAKYLNMAADKSCYLAEELIEEYGIQRVTQPSFGKIYEALKNNDNSKFWLT